MNITAAELQTAVDALRVHLIVQPNGSVLGLPISPQRHGNQNLRKIPRYRHQRYGKPSPPETA